jgi:hypothetical protein
VPHLKTFGKFSWISKIKGLTPPGKIFGYQFSTTVLMLGTMTPSRTFPAMVLLLI